MLKPINSDDERVADHFKSHTFDASEPKYIVEIDGIPIRGHKESVFDKKNSAMTSATYAIKMHFRYYTSAGYNPNYSRDANEFIEKMKAAGRLKVVPYKLERA